MKAKTPKTKMAKPKTERGNPIHIRFEYDEAIKSKRDILSTEMNLLRILRIIKKYHDLRTDELDTKIKLYKKIKELKSSLKKIEIVFPKIKIPNILKKEDIFETERMEETPEKEDVQSRVKRAAAEQHSSDIDYQLREIQEKLRALGE